MQPDTVTLPDDVTPEEMRRIAEEFMHEMRVIMTAAGMQRARIEREVERVLLTGRGRHAARQGQKPVLRVVS